MTRLTLLFLVAGLVLPGAALAMPAPDRDQGPRSALAAAPDLDRAAAHRKALATERYYSSYTPGSSIVETASPAAAPATVTTDRDGLSWTLAIGVGLILLAGGLGLYGGRMVRPRHIGA